MFKCEFQKVNSDLEAVYKESLGVGRSWKYKDQSLGL